MNQPILFPCSSETNYLKWVIWFLFGIIVIITIVYSCTIYPYYVVIIFIVVHIPSAFAIGFAYVHFRVWLNQLFIDSYQHSKVSIFLSDILNLNEFNISKSTLFYKKLCKYFALLYISTMTLVVAFLLSLDEYDSFTDEYLFQLWQHFVRMQIVFFCWMFVRFLMIPSIFWLIC